MKRGIIFFVSLVCVVASCGGTKVDIDAVEKAKDEAIRQIDEKADQAVQDAENRISLATDRALRGADEDISVAIDVAKSEIKSSVEKSVDSKLAAFENNVMKADRRAFWAAILALSALLAAAVFFLLLLHRSRRDAIIESVTESKRVERMIRDTVETVVNAEVKPLVKSLSGKVDVEAAVRRFVTGPDFEKMLKDLFPDKPEEPAADPGERDQIPSPRVLEMYAMDSPGTSLTRLSTDYQRGKSIYRLVLDSQDARTAQISLCTDKDEVRQRIFKSSNDLLEPICKVQRRSNNPEELSMIDTQPGKAERTSSESWEVTEPILVELS